MHQFSTAIAATPKTHLRYGGHVRKWYRCCLPCKAQQNTWVAQAQPPGFVALCRFNEGAIAILEELDP